MGTVVHGFVERRQAQLTRERPVEYVQEPVWFGVRLRPEWPVVVSAGAPDAASLSVNLTSWCGEPMPVRIDP